jgi:hypothetical protein
MIITSAAKALIFEILQIMGIIALARAVGFKEKLNGVFINLLRNPLLKILPEFPPAYLTVRLSVGGKDSHIIIREPEFCVVKKKPFSVFSPGFAPSALNIHRSAS